MNIINKDALQIALEKVKPGLARKDYIQQSTSFAFTGGTVTTYNDEISISHPVPGLDFTGAVKAEILYAFLNKIKKEEIQYRVEENQLIITAGRAKAGLLFEQEVLLPLEEIEMSADWIDLPENFRKAIKFAVPISSSDMTRSVLTCILVKDDFVMATDSFQIVKYQLSSGEKLPAFLIPAHTANIIANYEVKKIAVGKSWVHFRTKDDTLLSARTVQEDFPEVAHILDVEGEKVLFPSTMNDILERAFPFTQDEGTQSLRTVEVEMGKNSIQISAQDNESWFKENAKIRYKGESVSFQTRVDALISFLKFTGECVCGKNIIKFAGEDWEIVVATTPIQKKKRGK